MAALINGGLTLTSLAAEPSASPSATNSISNVSPAPRTYSFGETELNNLLTTTLQRDTVRDRGELELRFTRNWAPVAIPVGKTTMDVLELPSTGVTPNFIVRFALRVDGQIVGTFQIPVQAHVWRDVWVTRAAVRRGQLLVEADRAKERRDVLALRDFCIDDSVDESLYEIAEALPSGAPLTLNSVKLRRLVHRGQLAEAVVQDGVMSVSLKVEVLEDGVLGQFIRVRNAQSKREFRGKVENEQTILVSL